MRVCQFRHFGTVSLKRVTLKQAATLSLANAVRGVKFHAQI